MKKLYLAIGLCFSFVFVQAQFTSPTAGVQYTPDDVGIGGNTPQDKLHVFSSSSQVAIRVGYDAGAFDYYSRLLDDGLEWYKEGAGGGIPQRMAYIETDISNGDFLLNSQGDIEMTMNTELKFNSFIHNGNLRYEIGNNVFKMIAGETGQQMDLELIARDDIFLRADDVVKITAVDQIQMVADEYRFEGTSGSSPQLKLDFNGGISNAIMDGSGLKFTSSSSNGNALFESGNNIFKMTVGETGQQMDLELIASDDIFLRSEGHIVFRPSSGFKVMLEDRAFGGDNSHDAMFITADGRVGMGVTNVNPNDMPSGYRLYVTEGILAERVKVALSSTTEWSDYVFSKDYNLMSLSEVQAFIEKEQHLPNVPSADEVVEEGIDVAKMDALLLEKIEELTLYIIEQNKRIEALESTLNSNKGND